MRCAVKYWPFRRTNAHKVLAAVKLDDVCRRLCRAFRMLFCVAASNALATRARTSSGAASRDAPAQEQKYWISLRTTQQQQQLGARVLANGSSCSLLPPTDDEFARAQLVSVIVEGGSRASAFSLPAAPPRSCDRFLLASGERIKSGIHKMYRHV